MGWFPFEFLSYLLIFNDIDNFEKSIFSLIYLKVFDEKLLCDKHSQCLVTQLCLTLCNPMDCIPAGSSVHGMSMARILEWVAISSSRGSSQPRDQTHVSCVLHWWVGSLPLASPGKPELSAMYAVDYYI